MGWTGNPQWTADAYAAVHQKTGGIPRRINRLCSRVLLYGALEEATTITAEAVNATAEELLQDLEGESAEAVAAERALPDAERSSLQARIQRLEAEVARQAQLFTKLAELLAAPPSGSR